MPTIFTKLPVFKFATQRFYITVRTLASTCITAMSRSVVYVRTGPGVEQDRLHIELVYPPHGDSSTTSSAVANVGMKPRTYNLNRSKTENVGVSLDRLKMNILKHVNKKKKRKKSPDSMAFLDEVLLSVKPRTSDSDASSNDNHIKILDQTNEEVWCSEYILDINGFIYDIKLNLPTITSCKLPESIMSGFPIYPRIEIELGTITDIKFTWYASNNCSSNSAPVDIMRLVWTQKSNERNFIPDNSCIGCYIKLDSTPFSQCDSCKTETVYSKVPVSAGPGVCIFDARHLLTESITPYDRYRVVSYNILADLYADSDFSRETLFPYCPSYALHIDYRKQLFLKEIIGYNADIICLQEVDYKVFINDITPAFSCLELMPLFKMKGGLVNEGLITAFRLSKLKLLSQHDHVLSDLLQTDDRFKSITDKISHNALLLEKLLARTTAVQVSVFENPLFPGRAVCVANTHLYFHPQATHIRLLQTVTCIKLIESVVDSYKSKGYEVDVLFCGDLNSSPDRGSIEFIQNGQIQESHTDWNPDEEEDHLAGMNFSHSLQLANTISSALYTNYVRGFSATLDYIFASESMARDAEVIEPPSHEEVTLHTALPSIVYPSDHIAQVCELKIK